MEKRGSHCPHLLLDESAAKGTDFARFAGKEDPVELDSNHIRRMIFQVQRKWELLATNLRHHYWKHCSAHRIN